MNQEKQEATALTMGERLMQAGAVIALHTHGVEGATYIAKGEAFGRDGVRNRVVNPASAIYAPAGGRHSLATHGDKPMRFVFSYPAVNV